MKKIEKERESDRDGAVGGGGEARRIEENLAMEGRLHREEKEGKGLGQQLPEVLRKCTLARHSSTNSKTPRVLSYIFFMPCHD